MGKRKQSGNLEAKNIRNYMYRTINNSNNNDIEDRKGQYRIEKQGTEQKENRTKKGRNKKRME